MSDAGTRLSSVTAPQRGLSNLGAEHHWVQVPAVPLACCVTPEESFMSLHKHPALSPWLLDTASTGTPALPVLELKQINHRRKNTQIMLENGSVMAEWIGI